METPVADAYAALIPEHGFRRLAMMLEEACDRGLEHVPRRSPGTRSVRGGHGAVSGVGWMRSSSRKVPGWSAAFTPTEPRSSSGAA